MAWVAIVIGTTYAIDKIGSGYAATQNAGDVAAGQAAAFDIYEGKLDLLGDVKTTDEITTELQFEKGVKSLTRPASASISKMADISEKAIVKSDFATSGPIEKAVETSTEQIIDQYTRDIRDLVESKDIDLTKADIAYRGGKMSAEEAYQNMLTGFAGTPTTFWEGAFS